MSYDRTQFQVHIGDERAPAAPAGEGQPIRIVLLGDFSGQRDRGGAGTRSGGPVWRVDRDDLDAVMTQIAPALQIALAPDSAPETVQFNALDDFHPDRLVERLPLLRRLRALRIQQPGRSAGPTSRQSPTESSLADLPMAPDATSSSVAAAMAQGSLLDRIVENASPEATPSSAKSTAPRDDLSEYVQRAVRPHLVDEPDAAQEALAAKIDAVTTAMLRVLLHQPRFQALEAAWRSVDLLTRRLETGEDIQIFLIDRPRDELATDAALDDAPAHSRLHQLLTEGSAAERQPWTLLVAMYTFGPDDLPLVTRLARLARSLGVPCIAGADSRLAGIRSFADSADPDDWEIPLPAGWNAFRQTPDAAYLALAAPRFLLRGPYGADADACETLAFEEMDTTSVDHESYLWGNGAIACALAMADGAESGAPFPTQGTIGQLPFHIATVDGQRVALPCAEALLSQRAAMHLLDRGLTALASMHEENVIRIPRIQSLANPPRPLAAARSGAA